MQICKEIKFINSWEDFQICAI